MKTIRVYTRTVSMHTPEGWIKFSVRGSDEADMLELGYVDYDENGKCPWNRHGRFLVGTV